MCSEITPKAFSLSAEIWNLRIILSPVDDFDDRVLWCEPISISYSVYGWFLCRYCATGWFWWISGLRAVAMWSSSFTKKIGLNMRLFSVRSESYLVTRFGCVLLPNRTLPSVLTCVSLIVWSCRDNFKWFLLYACKYRWFRSFIGKVRDYSKGI